MTRRRTGRAALAAYAFYPSTASSTAIRLANATRAVPRDARCELAVAAQHSAASAWCCSMRRFRVESLPRASPAAEVLVDGDAGWVGPAMRTTVHGAA